MATPLTTHSEWLAENPPGEARLTQTLAGVARRVREGDDFRVAVREFLDEFALRASGRPQEDAIAADPGPTGDRRHDAYLGALAEHLAAVHALPRPAWSVEPGRFLDSFWFVSEVDGFRAVAPLVEGERDRSPADDVHLGGTSTRFSSRRPRSTTRPGSWAASWACPAASPQMLLALKVLAHRVGEDEGDVRLLAAELGLTHAEEVLEIAERTYGDRLDPAARFFVEEIFAGD